MKPKIITKSEFEQANNKQSYSNYVNYVNREESQNKFNNQFKHDIYIHYVFDESKTQSMFNDSKNFMDKKDVDDLKKSFKNAQDKNGIMWKEVISFDNDTLIKEGLYDSKTKILDEQKFRNSTRKMMEKFEDKEGLKNNLKWGASIHYNTDNIHVHVAGVENNVTRERGKIKQSTIDSMKSTFANDLFDISGERKAINEFIRDRIVKGLKENDELQFNKSFKKQTQKIHNKLKDIPLNQWNYNNNSLKHIRPDIDKLSEMYIQKYHSKEYEDFKDKLVQQSDIYKSTYGEKSNYKNYINTKIEDLYSRSGNTILKNIKQIHQNPIILNRKNSTKQVNMSFKNNNFKQNIKSRLAFNTSLNKIKQGLKKDFETERNIREYDYEFGIEKEHQRE